MAPTKKTPKPKPQKTEVGEQVLDLVIPYIHNLEDRNSISLVSRKCYATDGITRKRVTVHTLYYPNPASLSKRFPFIESLTLKGRPSDSRKITYHDMGITPWIEQVALGFSNLKELHIRRLLVHDEDLEKLARTRGKDIRSLVIKKCKGFSADGLMHVSKYCNQLRTLCLVYSYFVNMNDATWLHQLALNSTVLEKLHVTYMEISNAEDLTLLAKNCCNSLISLKIEECYLSKLRDAFRYAIRLEQFGGGRVLDEDSEGELVGFQFPPNIRSFSSMELPITHYSSVLPLLNQIRKLKLAFVDLDEDRMCLLFKRCPNLEVLTTRDVGGDSGDKGMQVLGQFCKKLRKLNHIGFPTGRGLIALAKGCTNLECLVVTLGDISNNALKFVGTHLKNLRKFRMELVKEHGTPLDNGIRAMLMGCKKLERLDISLRKGGMTDVGLEYIGKYGANLRYLSLTRIGNSDAGLVKLSEGCKKLRKLKLMDCPFSVQGVTSSVLNIPSLRYLWFDNGDHISLAHTL